MAKKLAKKDWDKGAKENAIKKNKSKKTPIAESNGIAAFINAISSKNYSQANKYLKGVIEGKLKQRINVSLNEPLF